MQVCIICSSLSPYCIRFLVPSLTAMCPCLVPAGQQYVHIDYGLAVPVGMSESDVT